MHASLRLRERWLLHAHAHSCVCVCLCGCCVFALPLCLASVGHVRGHDSVVRSAVALDPIRAPGALVTFDEVVAFDAAGTGAYPAVSTLSATMPAYVRDDWIALQRTGAWEESVLRAPRGELETGAATATAAEEKKSAPSTGPLVIHATMPAAPAAPQLTSPARTSLSLVDVDVQNSRPPPPLSKQPASAAASASPSSSSAAASASRSHASAAALRMPDQFLQYNPVTHQHSVVSWTMGMCGGHWSGFESGIRIGWLICFCSLFLPFVCDSYFPPLCRRHTHPCPWRARRPRSAPRRRRTQRSAPRPWPTHAPIMGQFIFSCSLLDVAEFMLLLDLGRVYCLSIVTVSHFVLLFCVLFLSVCAATTTRKNLPAAAVCAR